MTTYRSKTDLQIVLPIVILLGVMGFLTAYFGIWAGVIAIGFLSLFVVFIFTLTRYVITKEKLIIRGGFFNNQIIRIESIKKISETNSLLASPANSLDRLEIIYGNFRKIVVSPGDKNDFIDQLTSINPAIELKLKKNKKFRRGL